VREAGVSAFGAAPLCVDIAVTAACNLSCQYCYARASQQGAHLAADRVVALLHELDELGVAFVRIAGGEPLLHPAIDTIVAAASECGFAYSLSTNGTLLSKRRVRALAELDAPWVVVSVDGPTAEVHDSVRGGFAATVAGLRRCLEAGIRTTTATVLTSRNAAHVVETLSFLRNIGVERAAVLLFCPVGRGADHQDRLSPPPGVFTRAIRELTTFRRENPDFDLAFVPPHESETPWELVFPLDSTADRDLRVWEAPQPRRRGARNSGCRAGRTTCAIAADGTVFGCEQLMGFPELAAGNIHDRSFRSIWRTAPALQSLRRVDWRRLGEPCSACDLLSCGGGCRAVAYAATGTLQGGDPRCLAHPPEPEGRCR
jgi:radical SAM protein with 4Fe4S-binding SPASM domain